MHRLPDDRRFGLAWLAALPRSPAVLASAALGLTFLAAGSLWFSEQEHLKSDLRRVGRDQTAALEYGVVKMALGLEILAGFFRSSEMVTREEFHSFVQPYLRRNPQLQALAWAPVIREEDRSAVMELARREGLSRFAIVEKDSAGTMVRATDRPLHYPVCYVEPYEANEEALGFDLGSEPRRRAALVRAAASGKMTATEPISLVPVKKSHAGILLLEPIVDDRAVFLPGSVVGYALTALRADELIEEALRHSLASGVEVHVYHRQADDQEVLLAAVSTEPNEGRRSPEDLSTLRQRHHHEESIDVGGQRWIVLTTASPSFEVGRLTWQPWIVLIAGFLVTALLTAYVTVLQRAAARANAFAASQAESRHALEREAEQRRLAQEQIRALNAELERRVAVRTEQLQAANRELSAFAYSVSHDLRAPLRAINGFSGILLDEHAGKLDSDGRLALQRICEATCRMSELIDDLLSLSRLTQAQLRRVQVNLSEYAENTLHELHLSAPDREVTTNVVPGIVVEGDAALLRAAMENLLGNAWKYTARRPRAHIEFGEQVVDGERIYYVRDNGAGFDMRYVDKLFGAFQRLHPQGQYQGHGVGLATVQRVIHRHGGRVWAEGEVDGGATFYFTLGHEMEVPARVA